MANILSLFFAVLVGPAIASASASGYQPLDGIVAVTHQSIRNYFESSGRRIENIQIGKVTSLSKQPLSYLVEADVRAEAPVKNTILPYHCGVFLKRTNARSWQNAYTECSNYP